MVYILGDSCQDSLQKSSGSIYMYAYGLPPLFKLEGHHMTLTVCVKLNPTDKKIHFRHLPLAAGESFSQNNQ